MFLLHAPHAGKTLGRAGPLVVGVSTDVCNHKSRHRWAQQLSASVTLLGLTSRLRQFSRNVPYISCVSSHPGSTSAANLRTKWIAADHPWRCASGPVVTPGGGTG